MNPFQQAGMVLLVALGCGIMLYVRNARRNQANLEALLAAPVGRLDNAYLASTMMKVENDLHDAAPGSFIEHSWRNTGVLRFERLDGSDGATCIMRWVPAKKPDHVGASIKKTAAEMGITVRLLPEEAMEIRLPDRYVSVELVEEAFWSLEDEAYSGDLRWDIEERPQPARSVE